jgi:hypothetical protein
MERRERLPLFNAGHDVVVACVAVGRVWCLCM